MKDSFSFFNLNVENLICRCRGPLRTHSMAFGSLLEFDVGNLRPSLA
jgi:hypothetical protein